MRCRAKVFAAGLLLAGFVGMLAAPSRAVVRVATVATANEAWYNVSALSKPPSALGTAPVPAPPEGVPPLNPYAADTLHVAVSAGMETARTYLTLDTGAPQMAEIVGGTLSLPVNPGDGSLALETASFRACAASADFPADIQGGTGALPPIDCNVASPARFEASPLPRFLIDLAPFGRLLARSGLVLVPTGAAEAAQQTWHVALWGRDNPAADAQPITATVEFEVEDFGSPSPSPSPDFQSGRFDDTVFDFEPTYEATGDAFPAAEPSPPGLITPTASSAPADIGSGPIPFAPVGAAGGFGYHAVFILPLALMAALFWFGSGLIRPIATDTLEVP